MQRPWLGCRQCEDACPHGALTRSDRTLALDTARCTGCGRCAVECPTSALSAEGFALNPTPDVAVGVVCEKAAAAATERAGGIQLHRVPCVGGVAPADWLRLALAARGRPVVMIDDGSCERCETSAGGGNPGLRALDWARRALAGAGVAFDALPCRLEVLPLPFGNGRAGATSRPPVAGRRAFFAGLSRAVSAGVAHAAAPGARLAGSVPAAARARAAVPNRRGPEIRVLLLRAAHGAGRDVPDEADLPDLRAGDACLAHGACARACPTAALQLAEHDDRAVLRFDAWLCIDCGACARLCPQQALAHRQATRRPFPAGPVALAEVPRRACERCGAPIPTRTHGPSDASPLCDRCSKSQQLARAGFALFNPPGREPDVVPGAG